MIRQEFRFHKLNARGIQGAIEIAEVFTEALTKIELIVQGGGPPQTAESYLNIARQKMEEASFYAKKALASGVHNQESVT